MATVKRAASDEPLHRRPRQDSNLLRDLDAHRYSPLGEGPAPAAGQEASTAIPGDKLVAEQANNEVGPRPPQRALGSVLFQDIGKRCRET